MAELALKQESIEQSAEFLASRLLCLDLKERVHALNMVRRIIAKASPFQDEPVDFVEWVESGSVMANDYNPNSVAPPEMELLKISIEADGYTQPIVAMPHSKKFEVVDGFHRHRVGKEVPEIQSRVHGFLPVVSIREEQYDKTKRMASTVRHNRARGKHRVESMSDIVVELKRRNWTNARITKELGMDEDEVLRLCQITGLSEIFKDQEFSAAWDVQGAITEDDFVELSDDIEDDEEVGARTANTSDPNRVFHTFDKWECYKAGFYNTTAEGMSQDEAREKYRAFLGDLDAFRSGLEGVTSTWPMSCEHYLTNSAMNRIAWLGQAAACYSIGLPAIFRGGFSLLNEQQQDAANRLAHEYLNKWLEGRGMETVSLEDALAGSRQSEIY